MCSKRVEAWIKLIVKQILCIKLVKYWDKYTEMHGQQNVKKQVSTYFKILLLQVSTYFTSEMTVKFTLEQAVKVQKGSRDITVLFL